MRRFQYILIFFMVISSHYALAAKPNKQDKLRIAVVSSYHSEYIWSQETNKGVLAALLKFAYLDSQKQADTFTRKNHVTNSRIVLKKYWMDTKRRNSKQQISESFGHITAELDKFKPDIVLLGDDNAANYVGNYYLDTEIPVVFWGVNGAPLKYGLIDTLKRPGHNITGVYQAGYHRESVEYLKRLLPNLKRLAVLSDDSPTGRSHAKRMQRYHKEGQLDISVEKVVITNSYKVWKEEALALNDKVDAFYISTHNTLRDEKGEHVNYLKVARWYLENIKKPEITVSGHIVKEGFLATVDDSGYNQGYEAVKLAHKILSEGKKAADLSSYAPGRGPFIVNRWRAKMLGLSSVIKKNKKIIDELWDDHKGWE